jgi:DNA-binding MarR family transcriptional regulator
VLTSSRSAADQSIATVSIPLMPKFTEKQAQYLAFIHTYTLLNDRSPAEADMQQYFRVTPPSVHRMVIELEDRGLIRRSPGVARSIEVLLSDDEVPRLCRRPNR